MRGAVAVLAIAVITGGCASGGRIPVFGNWRITGYAAPATKGPSPVQSLALIGISAAFDSENARLGTDRCYKPRYTERTLSAAEFAQVFKAPAASLGLTTEPIVVYHVECPSTPGAQARDFILKAQDALLTPADGSFYELRRR